MEAFLHRRCHFKNFTISVNYLLIGQFGNNEEQNGCEQLSVSTDLCEVSKVCEAMEEQKQ
jgi:hypothetical protein